MKPPQRSSLIPAGAASNVNAPEEQDSDQIYALKGDIRILEDALKEAQDNNKQLVAEFTILNDNSEIEKRTRNTHCGLLLLSL